MIEKHPGGLRIVGPMLIANARTLLEKGRSLLLAEAADEVVVDLSPVAEVDSSSLGVMLGLLRAAAERGVKLRFVNPPASMMSLAGLYGVSEVLPFA